MHRQISMAGLVLATIFGTLAQLMAASASTVTRGSTPAPDEILHRDKGVQSWKGSLEEATRSGQTSRSGAGEAIKTVNK